MVGNSMCLQKRIQFNPVSILVSKWNGWEYAIKAELISNLFVSILVSKWNGWESSPPKPKNQIPNVSILVSKWNGWESDWTPKTNSCST